MEGTSLVVQGLRKPLPLQGDTGSVPGLGRFHMPRSNWAPACTTPTGLPRCDHWGRSTYSQRSATREATAARRPRTATGELPRRAATGERPKQPPKNQHSQIETALRWRPLYCMAFNSQGTERIQCIKTESWLKHPRTPTTPNCTQLQPGGGRRGCDEPQKNFVAWKKKKRHKRMHTACSRVYEIQEQQHWRDGSESEGRLGRVAPGIFRTSSGRSAQLPKAAIATPEWASY